jgi:hypothetical protein
VALGVAAFVCAVATASANASPSRSCAYTNPVTAMYSVQFLRTTGDTCDTARAVAHGVQDSLTNGGPFPRRVAAHGGRYDCTYRHRAGEPAPFALARCVGSTRVVTMRLSRRTRPV